MENIDLIENPKIESLNVDDVKTDDNDKESTTTSSGLEKEQQVFKDMHQYVIKMFKKEWIDRELPPKDEMFDMFCYKTRQKFLFKDKVFTFFSAVYDDQMRNKKLK